MSTKRNWREYKTLVGFGRLLIQITMNNLIPDFETLACYKKKKSKSINVE
jgi:hypothetical protein